MLGSEGCQRPHGRGRGLPERGAEPSPLHAAQGRVQRLSKSFGHWRLGVGRGGCLSSSQASELPLGSAGAFSSGKAWALGKSRREGQLGLRQPSAGSGLESGLLSARTRGGNGGRVSDLWGPPAASLILALRVGSPHHVLSGRPPSVPHPSRGVFHSAFSC